MDYTSDRIVLLNQVFNQMVNHYIYRIDKYSPSANYYHKQFSVSKELAQWAIDEVAQLGHAANILVAQRLGYGNYAIVKMHEVKCKDVVAYGGLMKYLKQEREMKKETNVDNTDSLKQQLQELVEEGERLTFNNNSVEQPYGRFGKLTSAFLAWNTKVDCLISEHYGESSAPMRLLARQNLSSISGNEEPEFNEQHAIIMGALQACTSITPKKESVAVVRSEVISLSETNNIFVVHGHDDAAREQVARTLDKLKLNPIILGEQVNQGKTIIEKFETHSEVGFAIILLTADDKGKAKAGLRFNSRARQNVILELGYFMGKLGRARIMALYENGVELPSDLHGIVYTLMDNGGAWKHSLAKELRAAGYNADSNLI